eukprot:TRINITY_DN5058_c0_g1_i1.p1 TRINITY_DN5058_c0_g1~~TRINITY_DN5058_c0_g1_i1.p1  ORF type:complete len:180 (+),score=3.94 TRINITY_DN5058_c0_g1_i1:922-1461(+)
MYVFAIGDVNVIQAVSRQYPKVEVVIEFSQFTYYIEFAPLLTLYEHANLSDPGSRFLYFHTKGTTNLYYSSKKARKSNMVELNVREHPKIVRLLQGGWETCGLFYRTQPVPHYSGFFFWANGEHIVALKNVAQMIWSIRFGAEFWPLSGGNKCKEFTIKELRVVDTKMHLYVNLTRPEC